MVERSIPVSRADRSLESGMNIKVDVDIDQS